MSFHISSPFFRKLHQNKKMKLKIFTLALSMVAANPFRTVSQDNEISSSDSSAVEEPRERRGLVSRLTYQIIFYFAKLVTLI